MQILATMKIRDLQNALFGAFAYLVADPNAAAEILKENGLEGELIQTEPKRIGVFLESKTRAVIQYTESKAAVIQYELT